MASIKLNKRALQDLARLRRSGYFTDAVIKVGSVRFPVHRNIIACCSPYFRALFEEGARCKRPNSTTERHSQNADNLVLCSESQRDLTKPDRKNTTTDSDDGTGFQTISASPKEFNIDGVSPDVMNAIIDHAYGGKVIITDHNIESLLVGSDRFQVRSLLVSCCKYLESHISLENCILIVKFLSRFYQCENTTLKVTQYFLDNFVAVSQTSQDFLDLTCDELLAVLKADRLNVRFEEQVLDAVIRWVASEPSSRIQHIPQLVACARVGLMYPEHTQYFVDSWLHPTNHDRLGPGSIPITLQVMEAVLQLQKQQMVLVDVLMFAPRLPKDVLVVVGGSNRGFPLNIVEMYDCRAGLWSIIPSHDFAPRSYHGVVSLGNEIYILGGFCGHSYLSKCSKFKLETMTWEAVPGMNTNRCYIGTAVLRGQIFAVGGFDGESRLNSAERHDTMTKQWSYTSPMRHHRSDAGVAVLDDKLYVCGGFNGEECIREAEVYEPDSNTWSPIRSMFHGRSGLGLAAYSGCLYAVGGFDGTDSSVRLRTVETYNPTTQQWTSLRSMFSARSNLAVEVMEDMLYAIGGYNGERTISAVEAYDFSSDTWYQCRDISHNRSALSACVLSGLSNTAQLLGRASTDHTTLELSNRSVNIT